MRSVVVAIVGLLFGANDAAAGQLPEISAAAAGMSASRLEAIADVVQEGLNQSKMPGCVVTVGRRSGIVFQRAFGMRQVQPDKEEMTVDTVFDLASLTKPIATATSAMILVQQGKLDLDAPVVRYLPEFGSHGKDQITVRHLLTHQGGLLPDNALSDYEGGRESAFQKIDELDLRAAPGERFIYSDVSFIVLARVVEAVSGLPISEFSREHIFLPLGMQETGYLPPQELRSRAAPTEQREGRWMQGEVHDPRAWALGGVAGHAGLFSTASDLAIYATMMLNRGRLGQTRILDAEIFEQMTRGEPVSSGRRGLGWDVRTGYSSNRGDLFSSRAFGHGGFTGTAIWMDPELDLYVIFLSNRVHPDGEGLVNPLAGRIGTLAAAAILADVDYPDTPTVLNGIDVARADNFRDLNGRHVGLITNHTGLARDGVSTVQLLHEAKAVDLVALFSPEHGLQGQLDVSKIGDTRDSATGLKVFSLYGESRTPTAESLQGIDALVFDIQDIGTRFYTYVSTMGHAMKAAEELNIRFVVLDRVNPIGGAVYDGPVLDQGLESFVGFHTLPVRHGMTIGELAQMFRTERFPDLDLVVVPVQNWSRSQLLDQTGLTWTNPSPNMRSLTQALLYPGIGLIETTNVSVGRGTDTPFEIIGAPWIDAQTLAADLNAAGLPGVRFVPVRFTPDSSRFANEQCGGVNLIVTSRAVFEPVSTGLQVACSLRKLYPDDWDTSSLNRLLADDAVCEAIRSGRSLAELRPMWKLELDEFRDRRRQFLLYK